MYIVLKMFALFFKELHFNWTYFFALPYELYTVFSYEFLCFIRTFYCLFPYKFSVFHTSFFAYFRPYFIRIFSSLYTNRLPYILHCFAFVYELLHEFESCTLETINLIVLLVLFKFFDAKTHLTMSMIVLFFHQFHSTCAFTVLELFSYCHQLLSYVFSNENSIMQYLNLGKAVLRPPFQASLSGST